MVSIITLVGFCVILFQRVLNVCFSEISIKFLEVFYEFKVFIFALHAYFDNFNIFKHFYVFWSYIFIVSTKENCSQSKCIHFNKFFTCD